MNSRIVGQLSPADYDPDFSESAPFPFPYFDNKALKVIFVEATYQPYLDTADKILENFLQLTSNNRLENADMVHRYYLDSLQHSYTEPLDINTSTDSWNFVTPTEVIIHWDEEENFYLCVSCECAWEAEHGLQLVFPDGLKLTRASGHDGHFTD